MPKGKKICPTCKAENGLRQQVCACGHEFRKTVLTDQAATAAAIQPSKLPAIDPSPLLDHTPDTKPIPSAPIQPSTRQVQSGTITTPAGPPPCRPSKQDGQTYSDSDIRDWALQTAHHNSDYSMEAIIYFARSFWDVHGPEFARVKAIIASVFRKVG